MNNGASRSVRITLKMVNRLGPALRKAESDLAGFRNKVTQAFKRAAAVITGAFIGAISGAAVIGSTFEQSMANVGSVASATAKEMGLLEGKARQMGAATAFSASQAADAMYSLASGGMDTAEMMSASEGVLKLAGATLSDMGLAAEATMSSLRMFNLSAEQTNRVVNVAAAGIKNSMLTMNRWSDSMRYAGPIASRLGMSIEGTTAALALLHNAGLKGTMAGTGFRMMLTKLINPSDKLKVALAGISVEEDGLSAVIGRLQQVNLSGGELADMFGARAFNAVSSLVSAGQKGFQDMTDKITGTNSAFEMYDRQMNTTQGKFKILKSAIQEDFISVFESIKPVLDDVIGWLTDWVRVSKPMFVQFAVSAKAAFTKAKLAAAKFFSFLTTNEETLKTLSASVLGATAALYAFSTVVKVGAAALAMFAKFGGRLSVIGLVLTAIGAGLGFAINKMGGFSKAWIKTKAWFITAAYDMLFALDKMSIGFLQLPYDLNALGKTIWEFSKTTVAAFRDTVTYIGKAWAGLGDILAHPFSAKEKWGELKTHLESGLTDAFVGFPDKVQKIWEDANAVTQGWLDGYERDHAASVARIKANRDAALKAADMNGSGPVNVEVLRAQFDVVKAEYDRMATTLISAFRNVPFLGEGGTVIVKNNAGEIVTAMRDSTQLIYQATANVFDQIADGIGAAVMDTKKKLIDLAAVGRSVFGSLISGFLKLGIKSALTAWGGGTGLAIAGFLASGGPVEAGKSYIVGEKGPERFVPDQSGTIIPNGATFGGGRLAGVGGVNLSVAVTIPQGSIVLADDNMAVRRFGETIARVIETRISRTFKE